MATIPRSPDDLAALSQETVVQDFWHHVEKTAGYDLPPSVKEIFLTYHAYCFRDPKPTLRLPVLLKTTGARA
jgi:hypothetical protein